MPPAPRAEPLEPGRWHLPLAGAVDHTREDAVADAVGRAVAAGAERLDLDLSGATALDGGGLGLLLRFGYWCREQGLRPGLRGVSPRARRVLAEQGVEAGVAITPAGPAAGPLRELCPPERWACGLGRVPETGPDGEPLPANVAGRPATHPEAGFGALWHKVYRLRLGGCDASPREAAALLHGHLGELWPPGNRLALVGDRPELAPGAVGHIHLRLPGGGPLSTGVRVLHRSPTSLTFATLLGHLEAGWITFGAHRAGGATEVRVESLARTGDPAYEVGFRVFGHGQQEAFWTRTLAALAERLGVPARVQVVRTRVDRAPRWGGLANLGANAAVRTGAGAARRLLGRVLR